MICVILLCHSHVFRNFLPTVFFLSLSFASSVCPFGNRPLWTWSCRCDAEWRQDRHFFFHFPVFPSFFPRIRNLKEMSEKRPIRTIITSNDDNWYARGQNCYTTRIGLLVGLTFLHWPLVDPLSKFRSFVFREETRTKIDSRQFVAVTTTLIRLDGCDLSQATAHPLTVRRESRPNNNCQAIFNRFQSGWNFSLEKVQFKRTEESISHSIFIVCVGQCECQNEIISFVFPNITFQLNFYVRPFFHMLFARALIWGNLFAFVCISLESCWLNFFRAIFGALNSGVEFDVEPNLSLVQLAHEFAIVIDWLMREFFRKIAWLNEWDNNKMLLSEIVSMPASEYWTNDNSYRNFRVNSLRFFSPFFLFEEEANESWTVVAKSAKEQLANCSRRK